MLQTYIPCFPKSATILNEKLAMDKENGQICFSTVTGPIYSCSENDKFGMRLAQGMLVSLDLASAIEVSKALGVHRSTVTRNVNKYEEKGPSGFINTRPGQKPYKFTKEKQRIVKRSLDKGFTIVSSAAQVGVSEGCVRTALRNGTIERKITPATKDNNPEEIKGSSQRSREDANCKSGIAVKRESERVLASKGKIEEALPEFTANEGINYAGVLLALPFLANLDYLETGKKVYGALQNGYYGLQSIFLVMAFMALLRIKNPEQLKNSNVGDLGIVLGLDRSPEVKTLRRKLKELGLENKSGEFMESLCRTWTGQDKDILGFAYIDGHVRPYHGSKHILPKTHVARRRLCMAATTDFWVNGTDCEPLFFVTTEANNSLLSTVDNEIIPELKRLSNGDRVTLVFDREGWSPDRFLKWKKFGIDMMTYRKGKYEPWPQDCFSEITSHVRGNPVTYKLGERSIKIKKKGWLREVRRLCDNGHQTSIISTRQDLTIEEIARSMFARWNQENFFKYMRDEYNLDHLVSRDIEQADIERMVPNPQKKALKKERAKKLRHLKTKKEHYATQAANNDEKQCRTMRGFNISNFGLKTGIKQMETEIEILETEIKLLPDKVKIKQILKEEEIVRLETEKKRLTDTIKMTCYRAETELYKTVDHNHFFARSLDEGRSFMQRVFQQTADIIPDYDRGRLEIRFHTMSTKRENSALQKMCKVVNEKNLNYPGTKLKLVFRAT